jgi:hypothetical protein
MRPVTRVHRKLSPTHSTLPPCLATKQVCTWGSLVAIRKLTQNTKKQASWQDRSCTGMRHGFGCGGMNGGAKREKEGGEKRTDETSTAIIQRQQLSFRKKIHAIQWNAPRRPLLAQAQYTTNRACCAAGVAFPPQRAVRRPYRTYFIEYLSSKRGACVLFQALFLGCSTVSNPVGHFNTGNDAC